MSRWQDFDSPDYLHCYLSAIKAANVVEEDYTVVFFWSFSRPGSHSLDPRFEVFKILSQGSTTFSWRVFNVLSRPRDRILLIFGPDLDGRPPLPAVKEGLRDILTAVEKKGAKIGAHIWTHDLSHADILYKDGKPKHWVNLEIVFAGLVQMNRLVFLMFPWGKNQLDAADQSEKIQHSIKKCVEGGLVFDWMEKMDGTSAWAAVKRAVEMVADPTRTRKRKRFDDLETQRLLIRWQVFEEKRSRSSLITNTLRPEMDQLFIELQKTEDGRRIHGGLKRLLAEWTTIFPRLLKEIDGEDFKPEEYKLFTLEMAELLGEARAFEIPVGPNLCAYYIGKPAELMAMKPDRKIHGYWDYGIYRNRDRIARTHRTLLYHVTLL